MDSTEWRLARHPGVVVVVVIAVVAIAAGVWTLSTGPGAVASGQPISSCTTIDESGRYVLTTDLTGNEHSTCLRIAASDVTLDGNNHRIEGSSAFGSAGLVAEPEEERRLSNVTVRDLTASGWDDAIRFISVDGVRVDGVAATDSRVGFSLRRVRDARVSNVTARRNALRGVSVLEAGRNLTLSNVTAIGNDLYGVSLVESGVRNVTLSNSTLSNNEFGVALLGARNVTLVGNVADDNRIAGIFLAAAGGNELRGNRVGGQFYGIFLADRSERNLVVGNELVTNAVGIRLRSSDRNVLRANTVTDSSDTAVLLISSDDVVVRGTTGSNNARGVSIVRSDNVTRENDDLVVGSDAVRTRDFAADADTLAVRNDGAFDDGFY